MGRRLIRRKRKKKRRRMRSGKRKTRVDGKRKISIGAKVMRSLGIPDDTSRGDTKRQTIGGRKKSLPEKEGKEEKTLGGSQSLESPGNTSPKRRMTVAGRGGRPSRPLMIVTRRKNLGEAGSLVMRAPI